MVAVTDTNRSPIIGILALLFAVISTLSGAARLGIKYAITRNLTVDDHLISVSMVSLEAVHRVASFNFPTGFQCTTDSMHYNCRAQWLWRGRKCFFTGADRHSSEGTPSVFSG